MKLLTTIAAIGLAIAATTAMADGYKDKPHKPHMPKYPPAPVSQHSTINGAPTGPSLLSRSLMSPIRGLELWGSPAIPILSEDCFTRISMRKLSPEHCSDGVVRAELNLIPPVIPEPPKVVPVPVAPVKPENG